MINFKGKLALPTEVQQLHLNDSYKRIPVSFVELNKTSKNDLEALSKAANLWRNNDIYAFDVYDRFRKIFYEQIEAPEERFFVLTKQRINLDKLDSSKILGVAELYKPDDGPIEIEFLQTDPAYINTMELPKIKHVGMAIVEGFKKILKDKEIALFTTPTAKPFYEKLGFKNIESNLMLFKR